MAKILEEIMKNDIPQSCYHVKEHGGLKRAVKETQAVLKEYQFVFRSDIKSYYESINFEILMNIIRSYVQHPILLQLLEKACKRTETHGGIFYKVFQKGVFWHQYWGRSP